MCFLAPRLQIQVYMFVLYFYCSFTILLCYNKHNIFVQGAINIYTKSSLRSLLLHNVSTDGASGQRSPIVVFHCEFSSKRGPSL